MCQFILITNLILFNIENSGTTRQYISVLEDTVEFA